MIIYSLNKNSLASQILDNIRFLSAVIVVLFHFGLEIMPGYEAVMIFFVLSGYFVGTSVVKSMIEGTFSWKKYLIDRLSRLYTVLIPVLLISYIVIQLDIFFLDNSEKYSEYIKIEYLISSLFFLQFNDNYKFAYNAPLWSLAYEFWYYILFPSILSIFYYKNFIIKIIFVIITSLILYLTSDLFVYFLLWLMGIIPAICINNQIYKHNKFLLILSGIIFFIFLNSGYIIYGTNHLSEIPIHYLFDFLVAISFTVFIYFMTRELNFIANYSFLRYGVIGSSFSYTLYLIHYPMLHSMVDILKYIKTTTGIQSLYLNISYYLVMLIIIFLLSYLISLFTEKKTYIVRKKINSIFNIKYNRINK